MQALGIHLLQELWGCRPEKLNDVDFVREALLTAAYKARATVITHCFHRFSPHGVSGVVVIAESHISIHTWPEAGYAAVDVFTCGDKALPHRAAKYIRQVFSPTAHSEKELVRGIPPIGLEAETYPEQDRQALSYGA